MTSQAAPTRGYSLPEFAVVLAVTALIVGLAASAYKTYSVRAEIANSLALAAGAEEHVTDAFKRTGGPPANREAAGLPHANAADGGRHDSIDIVDGRIDLRFGSTADSAIAGRTLSLTPFETANGEVLWICGNRIAGPGLHPLGFANGARQAVQIVTQIEPRYLTQGCR